MNAMNMNCQYANRPGTRNQNPICFNTSDSQEPPFAFEIRTNTRQNNHIAQLATYEYMIKQTCKWLAINLFIIGTFSSDIFPMQEMYSWTIIAICFLNSSYYIYNFIKLKISLAKCLEGGLDNERCRCDLTMPFNLVRYFKLPCNANDNEYWNRFIQLVDVLKAKRFLNYQKSFYFVGLFSELQRLKRTIKAFRVTPKGSVQNCPTVEYQHSEHMIKYNAKGLSTPLELCKYWKDYLIARKNEIVRCSTSYVKSRIDPTRRQHSAKTHHTTPNSNTYNCDIPEVLSQLQYQMASGVDEFDFQFGHKLPSLSEFTEFVRNCHRDKHANVIKWISNLRIWFNMKLRELVEQIDVANSALMAHNACKVRIGVSNISSLHMTFHCYEQFRTFIPLLPFLTVSHQQGYLLRRYRLLAADRCLRSYVWNAGGDIDGNWDPNIGPNDAELLMSFFSAYMDLKLPCSPFDLNCTRPFSDNYIILDPQHPSLSSARIAILKQWTSPPHYNVVIGGLNRQIPGGSNNLFLSLAYFIYCLKVYHGGQIGRMRLGKHGLNILWIVGDEN